MRSWWASARSPAAVDRDGVGQRLGASPAARRRACRGRPRGRRARARRARLVPHAPAPMTAARRTRGVPPSHSHCSSTQGQMRSVTAAARWRLGSCDLREGQRRAGADAHLVRADAPALAHGLRADDRRPGRRARRSRAPGGPTPRLGRAERAGPRARALGEDEDAVAAREDRLGGVHRLLVAAAAVDREGAERGQQPGDRPVDEQLLLGHEVDRPAGHDRDDEGVQERAVVGRDDERPRGRDVLAPDPAQAEVEVEERLQDRPQPSSRRAGSTPRPRARSRSGVAIHALDTPPSVATVTVRRCRSIAPGQHAEPSPEPSPPGRGRPRRSSTCAPSAWTTPTRRCSARP